MAGNENGGELLQDAVCRTLAIEANEGRQEHIRFNRDALGVPALPPERRMHDDGLRTQLFGALLENQASEQGASMTAMDNATRNAGEMIKKQTQIYNRTRQAMITKELIEIISGAEAL